MLRYRWNSHGGAQRFVAEAIAKQEWASYGLIARYQVVIAYTSSSSEQGVDKLIDEIASYSNDSKAVKIQADLREAEAPAQIIKATRKCFRESIDILVNNAGFQATKSLREITAEDFSLHYDLNVRAIVLMTQAVLPVLRSPGRVINISSVGARSGFAGLSLYCSSKAAVEGLTRCFAAELGPKGHTMNTVNPGPVETDLLAGVPQHIVQSQKDSTPMENRLGTPDDIAQIVAFLAEEKSRWITGQAISASGGWLMQ